MERVRVERGHASLVGASCEACGHVTFPRREWCPACRAPGGMNEVALRPTGVVESSVLLHVSTEESEAPYTLAIVRLDDGPSLLARVVGEDGPGARVRLVADADRDAFWFAHALDASPAPAA